MPADPAVETAAGMINVLFVIAFPPFFVPPKRTPLTDVRDSACATQQTPAGIVRTGKTGTQNTAASYRINWS
jgi:hypothetical protein